MNNIFSSVDLSKLQSPDLLEELDYEEILEQWKVDFKKNYKSDFDLSLESEPVVKLLETGAYRELLLRQRVNDSAREVMLAHSKGTNLDNLGALFGVTRGVEFPGDPDSIPPLPTEFESDEKMRKRIQLAPEGFSTAGPEGAYVFHAFSSSPFVEDVSIDAPKFESFNDDNVSLPANVFAYKAVYTAGLSNPRPGDVVVIILISKDTDITDSEVLTLVESRLSDENVRPLTDRVFVKKAVQLNYEICAEIKVSKGPGGDIAFEKSRKKIEAFVKENRKIGKNISLSGIYSALHCPGIEKVELTKPAMEITSNTDEVPECTNITLVRRSS